MPLQDEITKWRKEIKTDGYDMSIGELMSLYRDGELDLRPKFQRFFRWEPEQQSNFIESVLLGIPIPPIFVSQREDSTWEVVDGLQRLSTLFQFAGILRDKNNELLLPLTLGGTRYLTELSGKVWETDDGVNSLTSSQRIDIKRAKLRVEIILKESAEFSKYELFQRLNTGGSLASDQDVRNCILVDTNEAFFDWMAKLGEDENFLACARPSDKQVREGYHLELVTRFLVFRQIPEEDYRNLFHLGFFLNERIQRIALNKGLDCSEQENAFKNTFSLINNTLGSDAFRKYDPILKRYWGGFLISAFEAIAIGIGHNIVDIQKKRGGLRPPLQERVNQLWQDSEFLDWIRVGRTASSRLTRTITIGRRTFRP